MHKFILKSINIENVAHNIVCFFKYLPFIDYIDVHVGFSQTFHVKLFVSFN